MSLLDFLSPPEVAVVIEGPSFRIVHFRGKRILRWSILPLEPRFLRGSTIVNPQAVGKALKEALKELGLSNKGVVTALPGVGVTSRIISIARVSVSDVPGFVVREARRTMAFSEETSYLFWNKVKKGGDGGERVLVVIVPKEPLASLMEAFRAAGKKLKVVDFKPLSLTRAVNESDAIVVNVESESIEIVIALDDVPVLHRGVFVPSDQMGEYARARVIDEVVRTITYYNSSHPDEPLAADLPIHLNGEAALAKGLTEAVSDATGHPVESYRPVLVCPKGLPAPLFVTNMGIVLKRGR